MDSSGRSALRGVADTGYNQPIPVLAPTCAFSYGADQQQRLLQNASAPSIGSPTRVWLEEVLTAERDAVSALLQARHQMLLVDLTQREASKTQERLRSPEGSCARTSSSDVSVPQAPLLPASMDGAKHPFAPNEPPEQLMDWSDNFESEKVNDRAVGAPLASTTLVPNTAPTIRAANSSPKTDESGGSFTKNSSDFEAAGRATIGREISGSVRGIVTGLERAATRSEEHQPSCRASQEAHKRELSFLLQSEENIEAIRRFVESPTFELTIASVIVITAIEMAFQTQYQGMELGLRLSYPGYDVPAKDSWPGFDIASHVIDWIFGLIFTAELVVKVIGYRSRWFYDPWNYFDAFIVGLWLIEMPFKSTLPILGDASMLRTARLFRLLRLLKAIRTLQGFDSLYLLMTTLKGSLWVLGWSCVLLMMVQMLIAFLFFFILSEVYFDNPNYPEHERREVFEYFGTFTRAMLTMFEMTLANWPPVCRLLVENVSEWFTPFCVVHKLTIGFAVIGVINGVFMQETFKVAATDDRIMVRQKEREIRVHTRKMTRLFKAADSSGDGEIDLEEFKEIMQDPEIVMWLASMEITVREPESLYRLLDSDGDGGLTAEELVKGALKMRGTAKSVDVLSMRRDVADIKAALVTMSANVATMREKPELCKLPNSVFSEGVNFFDGGAKAREEISTISTSLARSKDRKGTGASRSRPITRSEIKKVTGMIVDEKAQPYMAQALSLKEQPLTFK